MVRFLSSRRSIRRGSGLAIWQSALRLRRFSKLVDFVASIAGFVLLTVVVSTFAILPDHALAGEPELDQSERRIIALARRSQAFDAQWNEYVPRVLEAEESLRRAAVLKRCPAIASHPAPFLSADLRRVLERLPQSRERAINEASEAKSARWKYRAALRTFERMESEERARLLEVGKAGASSQALSVSIQSEALSRFARASERVNTGTPEPAAVIWLRTYLEAEGTKAAFRRELERISPDLVKAFDRVQPIESHTGSDAQWLSALTVGLKGVVPEITRMLIEGLRSDQTADFARLSYFHQVVTDAERSEMSTRLFVALHAGGQNSIYAVGQDTQAPRVQLDAVNHVDPVQAAMTEVEKLCASIDR